MKRSFSVVLLLFIMCTVLVGCGKEDNEKKFCTELRSLLSNTRNNVTRETWEKLSNDVAPLYDKYCESSSICDDIKSKLNKNRYDEEYNAFLKVYSEQDAIKKTSQSLSGTIGFVDMDCQKVLEK